MVLILVILQIKDFFEQHFIKLPARLAIAVSGGIDSLALTFLLRDFCLENNIELFAVTIDHKMRKGSSDEALELAKILQKHKINHQILTVDSQKLSKNNIEANLREVRYELLYGFCSAQKIEHLFLGHHLGDGAENFLIRLFRGSQLDGLSAMQEVSQLKKIKLCRPLLNNTKDELKNFLQGKKIKWFEDETNDDEKFLRNKIRKFFNQFEEKDLIQKRIQSAAKTIEESKDFIDEILLEKARDCLIFQPEGSFIIDLEKYQQISPKIALKMLSLLLIEVSGNQYKPRLEGLKNFETNILSLKKGQKKNFYGCMAQILNNQDVARFLFANNQATTKPFKATAKKLLLIYRDEKEAQNPSQKFDEKTMLIDGRFLVKINSKANKKFYFRTILAKIFAA